MRRTSPSTSWLVASLRLEPPCPPNPPGVGRNWLSREASVTWHNLDEVLAGSLDEITATLQDAEKRKRLEDQAEA